MISDLNICRAAKLLVDQHGAEAVVRAVARADGLFDDGDAEGAAIWRQITAAIEELPCEMRPDETVN